VAVIGGLLPIEPPVPVQLTVPAAATGDGVHVAPATLTVEPGVAPVQLTETACEAVAGLGEAVHEGTAGGAPTDVKTIGEVLVLPAGSVEVIDGFDGIALATPVHVTVVPVAGLGVHVVPGIALLVPGSTPVQLMLTEVEPPALVGEAVHEGAAGGVVSTTKGTVPPVVPLVPAGPLTVIGGLLPNVVPVPVQLTVPVALTVAGVHEEPGILTCAPGVAPLQLMVTAVAPAAGFGVLVQTGSTGAVLVPTTNGTVVLFDKPVVGLVEVTVGLLATLPAAVAVHVTVPLVAGLGEHVVPGITLLLPT
jgi:hypothetical protein